MRPEREGNRDKSLQRTEWTSGDQRFLVMIKPESWVLPRDEGHSVEKAAQDGVSSCGEKQKKVLKGDSQGQIWGTQVPDSDGQGERGLGLLSGW